MNVRSLALPVLALLAAGTTGCIIIPVPRSTAEVGARGSVDPHQVEFLRDGETRRREVLLELGEPDDSFMIGDQLVDSYLCDVSRSDVHFGGAIPFPAPPFLIPFGGTLKSARRDFLFIKFDGEGTATRHGFKSYSYSRNQGESPDKSVREVMEEWDSGKEPEPPPRPRRK